MRIPLLLLWAFLIHAPAWAGGVVPHADLPTAEQPARRVPITGYTLALGWAPEYCHARRGDRADGGECRGGGARGFTLHGLWPDGAGFNQWPQYCHPVAILTEAQMAPALAATPSPQLLQHEWAKHGSCTGDDPARYFAEAGRLYRAVAIPDMAALAARRDVTAGDVQQAFARANPSLRPEAVRVNANRRGWLNEVWLCLGQDRRPRPCPAYAGAAGTGTRLRIQAAGYVDRPAYVRAAYGGYRRYGGSGAARDENGAPEDRDDRRY